MLPIGPLMIEHRLIERMIALLGTESSKINDQGRFDTKFIEAALDFLKVYADRCHHGKEENILFKELAKKPLSTVDQRMLESLISDHVRARGLVSKLAAGAKEIRCQPGAEKLKSIAADLEALIKLYQEHIRKEDREFFVGAMGYFNKQEQNSMLCAFWEFDRMLIHEKYKSIVEQLEKGD